MLALIIGHSETEKGASNDTHNVSEFDFNRTLAKLVKLHWGSAKDLILVYRDCSYKELPEKINNLGPEAILSLHCNAFNGVASGTETLYYYKSRKGEACAEAVQHYLVKALGLHDRGIKPKMERDRGGFLLKNTKATCVIAEPFFIDNDLDYEIAWNNLDKLVEAYVMALRKLLWTG